MLNISDSDKKSLLSNRHVKSVTLGQVVFTPEFKIKALKLQQGGLTPQKVFLKLGIDPLIFLSEYPKKCLVRWKRIVKRSGEAGLKNDKRGRLATGRPKKKAEDPKSLVERIAFLEAENDFLKKLRALDEETVRNKGTR